MEHAVEAAPRKDASACLKAWIDVGEDDAESAQSP
jgi:hypothetical protein